MGLCSRLWNIQADVSWRASILAFPLVLFFWGSRKAAGLKETWGFPVCSRMEDGCADLQEEEVRCRWYLQGWAQWAPRWGAAEHSGAEAGVWTVSWTNRMRWALRQSSSYIRTPAQTWRCPHLPDTRAQIQQPPNCSLHSKPKRERHIPGSTSAPTQEEAKANHITAQSN